MTWFPPIESSKPEERLNRANSWLKYIGLNVKMKYQLFTVSLILKVFCLRGNSVQTNQKDDLTPMVTRERKFTCRNRSLYDLHGYINLLSNEVKKINFLHLQIQTRDKGCNQMGSLQQPCGILMPHPWGPSRWPHLAGGLGCSRWKGPDF